MQNLADFFSLCNREHALIYLRINQLKKAEYLKFLEVFKLRKMTKGNVLTFKTLFIYRMFVEVE